MVKDIITKNERISLNDKQLQALKEYFPACFHDGEFDMERFKEYLGNNLSVNHEGYELKFLGKNYARLLASVDTTTVVVPDEEHNSKPENANSQNVYISGDNLDALKHLLKSYYKQVKCIYIDPPYNTGSDGFVYNDTFNFTVDDLVSILSVSEEQATRILNLTKKGSASHSAWLMFMCPRLELARDLLTNDGIIFISIDDNEQSNCKLLCDMIFGEENYINTISVFSKVSAGASGGGEDKKLKKNIEYILIYARNFAEVGALPALFKKTELKDYLSQMKAENKSFKYINVLYDYDDKRFVKTIKDGNGDDINIYKIGRYDIRTVKQLSKDENLSEEAIYIKYFDKIMTTTNAQTSIRDRVWDATDSEDNMYLAEYTPKTGKDKGAVKELLFMGRQKVLVIWFKDTAEIIDGKIYKKEKIGTFWDGFSWINVTKEGNVRFDNGKKPIALIQQILNLIGENNDITVLDFFSGSASTAHAVIDENLKNNKHIKFIMVQFPEKIEPTSKDKKEYIEYLQAENIVPIVSEIGKERIKRACKKIKEEHPDTTVDLGFRHYTLAEPSATTLDKIEKFNPDDNGMFASDMLSEFGLPTVLATWLVRDGYGLTATPQMIDFANYQAYYIGKHLYLITHNLTKEAIDAILVKYETDGMFNPENVVLFGYSFTWTELETLKTNLKRLKEIKNLHVNFDIRY